MLPERIVAAETETGFVGTPVVEVLHCMADTGSCRYSTCSLAVEHEIDLAAPEHVCSGRMMVVGSLVFGYPFDVVVVCVAVALLDYLFVVCVAVCTFLKDDSVCRN